MSLNYCLHDTKEFPKHHNIEKLWNRFESLFVEFDGEQHDPEDFANAKHVILEFSSVDQGSFAFRYPVDKQGNHSLTMKYISLEQLGEVISRMANFLDATVDYLEQYVDITNEMRADFYSEIQQEYC